MIGSFGRSFALLKCFSIINLEKTPRTFSHGQNFECDNDIGIIAKPGSTTDNAFIVNYHHQGGRFTVLKPGLVTGDIDVSNPPEVRQYTDFQVFSSPKRHLMIHQDCITSGTIHNRLGPSKKL